MDKPRKTFRHLLAEAEAMPDATSKQLADKAKALARVNTDISNKCDEIMASDNETLKLRVTTLRSQIETLKRGLN